MDTSSINMKKQQRQTVLSLRDAIPENIRREKSLRICENLLSNGMYQSAQRIMLFRAFRSEADLSLFEERAKADGKTLLYPYCIEDRKMLALLPGENAWETDAYGIAVPVRKRAVEVSPEDIDLVICPCSAFDEEGRRLGMGAGYYDRFLPRCVNARFAVAAFEEQYVPRVVTDEHDIRMHAIFTDERKIEL